MHSSNLVINQRVQQDLFRDCSPYLLVVTKELLEGREDLRKPQAWEDHLIPMPRGYFQGQVPEDDFMQGVILYFLHAGFEGFNRLGQIEGFLLFPHPDAGLESSRSFGPTGKYSPKIPESWVDRLSDYWGNKKFYNFPRYM
jgi:hypothetical protein